jgi:hypothetical protein
MARAPRCDAACRAWPPRQRKALWPSIPVSCQRPARPWYASGAAIPILSSSTTTGSSTRPALPVADNYRRADYRGALVGPAVLWPDQARVHLAPSGDQSVTRPATNGTRRKGTVRCGIYTRKSSGEGLGQEFNSLQAQREACEAFITSQRHESWICLPKTYDDGGFSGATMERPALQRLLADITAGRAPRDSDCPLEGISANPRQIHQIIQ